MGPIELAVIATMLLLNGVFAAYELALASVNPQRLKTLAEEKRPGARAALHMKHRMEASLAAAQLGITVVGAVAAAVSGANAGEYIAPRMQEWLHVSPGTAYVISLTLVVLPLSAVMILLGELLPKVFAVRNNELVCLTLSPPMRVFAAVVYPVVWVFESATKRIVAVVESMLPRKQADTRKAALQELRAQVQLMRAGRMIGEQEEQIILRAARLSALTVADIMLEGSDIVVLHVDAPLSRSLVAAHLDLHTRFPVTEKPGDIQSIIGYINFKEMVLLAKTHPKNPSLREIVRPLISLSGNLPVSTALRMMMAEHLHLALVRDSAGAVIGMLTQEDIFETLVGDIQDEFDRLPRYVSPAGRQFVVGGGTNLQRLRDELRKPTLGQDLQGSTTLNTWLKQLRGARLRGGDVISVDGITILVRKVRRHQVSEALIDPSPDARLALPREEEADREDNAH